MRELDRESVEHLKPFAEEVADGTHAQAEIAAVLEAMFLLAIADGEVAPDELARFARSAAPLLGELSESDIEGTFADFASQLSDDGWDARVKAVGDALRDSALRDRAYRLAVAVAMIDDRVVPEEAGAMDALAEALGLGADRAHELVKKVYGELFGQLNRAARAAPPRGSESRGGPPHAQPASPGWDTDRYRTWISCTPRASSPPTPSRPASPTSPPR